MPAGTQKDRPIAVATTLGEDILLFHAMNGVEELGRPFEFELDLLSDDFAIPFDDVLGKPMAIRVKRDPDEPRFFHGIVSRFALVGQVGELAHYHAIVRPWFWLLTRTTDCRIFQEKSVPDILKQIFKEYGFSDYDIKLNKTYGPWEYCVQYRESDFDFLSRLMEHEGIYYYFRHEAEKHILVVSDAYGAHKRIVGHDKVHYWPPTENVKRDADWIWDWSLSREVRPVKVSLRDFDFKKPQADLTVAASLKREHAKAEFELYDFPGAYIEGADGEEYAKARLEGQQARFETVRGVGNTRGLFPGGLFELEGYPRDDQNREYLVTRTSYELLGDSFGSGANLQGKSFTVRFSAIDAQIPFRSPHRTPKPIVHGCQTATVVGPSNEEIYTDEFGRVKVHFHWDREDAWDDKSSCWIRVASVWAGTNWGGVHIPRIGQEVIVEFLEGDPDLPIITGRVYNADNMPPYGLPDNKTQSGLKSRSTKGGGGGNFNEMRFEDKKGSEELFMHAEKDWKVHVKNAETETVGAGITTNAGGSISRSAGENHARTADKNINDKAGVDITTDSGKDMKLTAGGAYELHTNLGIHLKAMNFVGSLIESGAKAAADAVKKGAAGAAVAAGTTGAKGGSAEQAASHAGDTAQLAGMAALAALSPAIEAGTAEISKLSAGMEKGMTNLEAPVQKAIAKMDSVNTLVQKGASPEVLAGAVMAMAEAAAEAWKAAAKVVEEMLPQIPSIVFWAMKDIKGTALWAISLTAEVKDIELETKNKDINLKAKRSVGVEAKDKDVSVKAKQNVTLEASEKNLSLLAKKKDLMITAKEKISIKAEDKDIVIDAGKTRVIVTGKKQLVLKCGKASIALKDSGDVLIKGGKITLKGTEALTAKGNPIKLN